jgi:Xaa-Pro aminopeptidase
LGRRHLLSIQPGEKRLLEEGMVFHVVPGIFLPRQFMVGISETLVVTKSGCECLTHFPREVFVSPGRNS